MPGFSGSEILLHCMTTGWPFLYYYKPITAVNKYNLTHHACLCEKCFAWCPFKEITSTVKIAVTSINNTATASFVVCCCVSDNSAVNCSRVMGLSSVHISTFVPKCGNTREREHPTPSGTLVRCSTCGLSFTRLLAYSEILLLKTKYVV